METTGTSEHGIAGAVGPPAYTRFVILASARTGSTMLASLLNTHPQIVCFQELFNPVHDFIMFNVEGYDNDSAADRALRDTDPAAFLQQRIFCKHRDGARAVGFKVHYEHIWLVERALDWLVAQRDIRVVHLRRRNLLRALVSFRIAEQTGVWQVDSLTKRFTAANALKALRHPLRAANVLRRARAERRSGVDPKDEQITLLVKQCQYYFGWSKQSGEEYEAAFAGHPLLNVCYEDIVDPAGAATGELLRFLGVEERPLAATTVQQNPKPLRDLIANYDELREAFKDTKNAAYFD